MALTKEERKKYNGLFALDGTVYFDAPQALVVGVFPENEFTLLTAPPKGGKSTFAAHSTFSVATGEPFFGREVREQGLVLYIALERAYQTQQRLYRLFDLGETSPHNVVLFKPQESDMESLFFNRGEDVDKLISRLEGDDIHDIKLVVVDSLENTLLGSDSDSADAGAWCNGFQRLLEHFETTGLVLHHETKASEGDRSSTTAYRGSSVFYARCGQWIRAIQVSNVQVQLQAVRGNFGSDWSTTVGFNDFGLFSESMPERAKAKRPDFGEFVEARLRENPRTTTSELTRLVQVHPESVWSDITSDRISKVIRSLGGRVAKHPNPVDGRSHFLELVG